MSSLLRRTRDGARFVITTLVISGLYLALVQVDMHIFDLVHGTGILDDTNRWADEADDVAAASIEAERRLPPASRLQVWRLGHTIGFASQYSGSLMHSDPEAQRRGAALVTEFLKEGQDIGDALRVGPVTPLPMHTVGDFSYIIQRIEADETGIAASIEARLSRRHAHLALFAMHVGAEECRIVVTRGQLTAPDRAKIGRHATLAAIPPELWQPLAEELTGLAPEQVQARYQQAVEALEQYLIAEANQPLQRQSSGSRATEGPGR